jgi:hypothetical protein
MHPMLIQMFRPMLLASVGPLGDLERGSCTWKGAPALSEGQDPIGNISEYLCLQQLSFLDEAAG